MWSQWRVPIHRSMVNKQHFAATTGIVSNKTTIMIILTHTQILTLGLKVLGFTDQRIKRVNGLRNVQRFRSHYGSDPIVYAVLLHKLQTTNIHKARVDHHVAKVGEDKFVAYFMMAIHLLACYPTEDEAESTFAKCPFVQPCKETWSHWVWTIIANISALMPEVIVWPSKWDNPDADTDDETIFIFTVDGIHCLIEEPTLGDFAKNWKFYSHKFHAAGLDYEVGISIFEQKCVWINGPYGAGKNDVSVFRHKLKPLLQQARENSQVKHRGIADRGYRGERALLSVPSSMDTPEVRYFKQRALSRHENFNGRLKNFDCLEERFRHSIKKHKHCFNSCAVIVQLQLENGSPLFVV